MALGWIAGVIGAISGVAGAASQAQAQAEAYSRQEKYLDAQYGQDKLLYEFNWEETLRNYDHVKTGIQIKRAEEETIGRLKDAVSLDQYKYNLAVRDFDYLNQLKQYQQSEKVYATQRNFNNMAANLARESELARYQEIQTGAAFDMQDLVIEMMQQEGLQTARGVAGNSSARAANAVLSQVGRDQSVLAESLVSARKETNRNLRDISIQKYGADLSAEANRMLRPEAPPEIPVPYKTPRAFFQDPLEPKKGPPPVRGVNTSLPPSPLGIIGGITGGIASGITTGIAVKGR